MKRKLVLLAIAFFALAVVFSLATAKSSIQSQKPAVKVFKGMVDSVTLGDPNKGTKSELVIIGANKQKLTFLVKSTATITDPNKKPITLDKVHKGDKCTVTYSTTSENVNEAISISLLK